MLNLWHAYIRAAQVGWDANVVVAMRLMRLGIGERVMGVSFAMANAALQVGYQGIDAVPRNATT